jgi:2-iminobutanoate/2-iminopropanoate deaminase
MRAVLDYCSGGIQRAVPAGTRVLHEGSKTRQNISRIDRIIKAAGGTMDNLVKMANYVVDIKNSTEVWRARHEFFTGIFPLPRL